MYLYEIVALKCKCTRQLISLWFTKTDTTVSPDYSIKECKSDIVESGYTVNLKCYFIKFAHPHREQPVITFWAAGLGKTAWCNLQSWKKCQKFPCRTLRLRPHRKWKVFTINVSSTGVNYRTSRLQRGRVFKKLFCVTEQQAETHWGGSQLWHWRSGHIIFVSACRGGLESERADKERAGVCAGASLKSERATASQGDIGLGVEHQKQRVQPQCFMLLVLPSRESLPSCFIPTVSLLHRVKRLLQTARGRREKNKAISWRGKGKERLSGTTCSPDNQH